MAIRTTAARPTRLRPRNGIPARAFWSLTLYDNQSRSMLQTSQRFPRAGSQSYPSPAAEAASDGSTTVFIGPKQPEGVKRGNWIQTDPQKGWFIEEPARYFLTNHDGQDENGRVIDRHISDAYIPRIYGHLAQFRVAILIYIFLLDISDQKSKIFTIEHSSCSTS